MRVEQRDVVGVRHCEGMVCCHEALFFVAPFKQREVYNPQTLKLLLVAEAKAVGHFQAQCAELCACLVGLVAAENEHEVAVVGSHFLFHLLQGLGIVEFVDT